MRTSKTQQKSFYKMSKRKKILQLLKPEPIKTIDCLQNSETKYKNVGLMPNIIFSVEEIVLSSHMILLLLDLVIFTGKSHIIMEHPLLMRIYDLMEN